MSLLPVHLYQCIENVAEFCLNEACDIEEYEALINQLQDQRDLMTEHVAKVTSLLARLQGHEFEVTEGTKDAETLMQSVGNTLELDVSFVHDSLGVYKLKPRCTKFSKQEIMPQDNN